MVDEAERKSLESELKSEYPGEEVTATFDEIIALRGEAVMKGMVVVDHEYDRITENAEENRVLEPAPCNEPHQTSTELTCMLNTAEGSLS